MSQTARPAKANPVGSYADSLTARPAIPRRLVDQQRRLRQAGRIRTGFSVEVPGKKYRRPAKSPTFILTSQQRGDLEVAQQRWGGEIDRWKPQGGWPEEWRLTTETDTIEALLPPGDPLTSRMEFWVGPNCVRRCDGVTEYIGDPAAPRQPRPCVCSAVLGPEWRGQELSDDAKKNACKLTTRLNVFLPTGDAAYWRLDVHSWFAAAEMTGIVDWIKDSIGVQQAVPVSLRIEQRSKPGKDYQVVVIELRGQVARQILSGIAPSLAIEAGDEPEERTAIAAAPAGQPAGHGAAVPVSAPPVTPAQPPTPVDTRADSPAPTSPARAPAATGDLGAQIAAAMTEDELKTIWNAVAATKDNDLKKAWYNRRTEVRNGTAIAPAAVVEGAVAAADAVEAETEPDRETMWMQALNLAGKKGWDTPTTSQRFRDEMGKDPAAADGWTHQQFLEALQAGRIA